MTALRETVINDRWKLLLPEHRAARPEWPWWEATRLAAMWHRLQSGDVPPVGTVYDIGAEEGDLPALWASWGNDVVLVEPNDRVWPNIKTIWQANDLDRYLVACFVGFAASQQRGATFIDFGWPDCADGAVIGDHGFLNLCERRDVAAITVDDLASATRRPPTAITIDVEGAELEVLRGAEHVLHDERPDVWVSVHPEFMADMYGIADGERAVVGLMERYGYESTFLCADHERHWQFLHPSRP